MSILSTLLVVLLPIIIRTSSILFSIRIYRSYIGPFACATIAFWTALYINPNFTESYSRSITFQLITLECLLGILIGSIISIPMEFIPFVGRLIDTFSGAQLQEQVAPELGPRDSKLEIFFSLLMLLFLMEIGFFKEGVSLLLSISELIQYLELHTSPHNFIKDASENGVRLLIQLIGDLLRLSLVILIPLIAMLLMLEFSLSFLLKIFPKLSLGNELSLIRVSLGLFIIPLIFYYSEFLPITFDYYLGVLTEFKKLLLNLIGK